MNNLLFALFDENFISEFISCTYNLILAGIAVVFFIFFIVFCACKKKDYGLYVFAVAFIIAALVVINNKNTEPCQYCSILELAIYCLLALSGLVVFHIIKHEKYMALIEKARTEGQVQIKEVIKDVPVYKEVIKEVPVYKEVVKEVVKESPRQEEVEEVEEPEEEVKEEKHVNKAPEKRKEDKGPKLTLKESIDLSNESKAGVKVDKDIVANWLMKEYKKRIVINTRENYTKTGLPLADTHYIKIGEDKVCFIYVYELNDRCFFIVKANEEIAKAQRRKKHTFVKSDFPKTNDGASWYTMVIDDTYKSTDEVFNVVKDVVKDVEENYEED